MIRLIIKITILLLVLLAFVKAVAYLCRAELDPYNYLAAIASKHQRLESVESPRVILIGDSSLPFGFDAARAQESLGLPVVNMGLHAAFGLEFILKEILPDIKSGDIVALVVHYYPSQDDINEGVVCHALDFYPEMYRRLELDPLHFIKLKVTCDLKRTSRFLLNKSRGGGAVKPEFEDMVFDYKTWALNDEGDFYGHLYENSETSFTAGSVVLPGYPQEKTMQLLDRYQKEYQARGVKLLLIYPPFPQSAYDENIEAVQAFDNMIRETSVEALNQPVDSVLSDSYFFNSDYHLTSEGKTLYTDKVTDILKNYFNFHYE